VRVELDATDITLGEEVNGQLFDWQMEGVPMRPSDRYMKIKLGAPAAS
jgi:hypothetical protein